MADFSEDALTGEYEIIHENTHLVLTADDTE